jgi:hypothetical protein
MYLRLTLRLAIVYIVPIGKAEDATVEFSDTISGMILAVTNRQVGLKYVVSYDSYRWSANNLFSVVSELIIGYMLPGRPVAMMMYVPVFCPFITTHPSHLLNSFKVSQAVFLC